MNASAFSTAPAPHADAKRRRRLIEDRLRAVARPRLARRSPPPEGQLGADEQPLRVLRDTLIELGPVFASFGRYLASRVDLLPRRERLELAQIPDRGDPVPESDLEALVQRELGAPPDRRFFAFDFTARDVRAWTERHDGWLAPGVPVTVTIVRPGADRLLAADVPLLHLIGRSFALPGAVLAQAIDDFVASLRQRLDQVHQASSLGKLAGDAAAGGLFVAPLPHRSHCSASILTTERIDGHSVAELAAGASAAAFDPELMARRTAGAWLRQATAGSVVPYDFDLRDVTPRAERLLLTAASFEPHSSSARARFLNYITAVAADDADAAAAWLMADRAADAATLEDEVRRRLRQAVPFRDGEWSGDERLVEQLLVQWRVVRLAGLDLTPHQLRVYRGLYALSAAAASLAPDSDPLLAALQEERLRAGFSTAQPMIDPRELPATFERMLKDMVNLPQKLDEVLTLAADGRLRVRLQLPPDEAARRTRNRTVSLVSSLVVLVVLAFALRHAAFAQAPGIEQAGALIVMAVGLWLLVAAAKL